MNSTSATLDRDDTGTSNPGTSNPGASNPGTSNLDTRGHGPGGILRAP